MSKKAHTVIVKLQIDTPSSHSLAQPPIMHTESEMKRERERERERAHQLEVDFVEGTCSRCLVFPSHQMFQWLGCMK